MKRILLALAITVGLPLAAYAQVSPPGDPMKEEVHEMKDGTKIIHNANGTMYHVDGKGRRVTMEGNMEAKDGTVYIMKNGYVGKRVAKAGNKHDHSQ